MHLVVSAQVVPGAGLLARDGARHEGVHVHGVLPETVGHLYAMFSLNRLRKVL